MEYIIIIGVICVLAFIVLVAYKVASKKKSKIQACDIHDFDCVRKNIHSKKISEKEKIIDYDKLYHKVLLKAGYHGGFGDILKTQPSEVKNLNKIWELHKVRNLLVHEIGYPEGVSLFQVANDYKKEVNSLLKEFGQ